MKSSYKLGLIALFIIVSIIGAMFYVTSILKDEAVTKYQNEVKLQVSSISSQVSQIIKILTNDIENISLVIEDDLILNDRMKKMLSQSTFIRSINIIDDKNKIIKSSNSNNIGKMYAVDNFYPKPMFNSGILRFGDVLQARDLFLLDEQLSLIPVSKKIEVNQKSYNIIFTLNNEYFKENFVRHLHSDIETLEIIRLDGQLLYSSNQNLKIGTYVKETQMFNELYNTVSSWGIETIDGVQFISAYYLTDTFPLVVLVKLDYNKGMESWEFKTNLSLFFMSIFILIISFIIIKLIFQYSKSKNKEIEYQNKLLKNQEKIKNAYIVYENTNDGILITDVNRNIIDVNKSFVENTGYTLEEVYGKNPRLLKSNNQDEIFYENMWDSINKNHYWHGEVVNKAKNGELFTELLTVNTVFDSDGNIKNYVGIFTNITVQKEQDKLLNEQQRFIHQQSKMASMGEMLENIAHQWRQPLSIISTAATGIKVEKQFGVLRDEVELERLTLINESAQHLSHTIDDFRDFFKPDKKKEDLYLEEVFNQAINILESKFKNRNVQVIKNISNIKVRGYRGELIQVFMNILNNARDVLENQALNERFIVIDIYKKDKNAIISIQDSGGGIDDLVIDKVFEPYFTTKHKSQGTGIGLYMSEEIITKHMDGLLKVENTTFTYEDQTFKGALFTISILSVE